MIILITGGCGFIGSNFVRYLCEHHPEDRIVVLDALTYAGNLANLDGLDVPVVTANIADTAAVRQVFRQYHPTAVVHLAAESHVDRSIIDPLLHVRTNALGTAVVVEAAREAKVERFLHVSTDEVYGSLAPDDPPFTEESPIRPNSPYAASKAAADHLVLAAHRTYSFPAIVIRCSNNYGPNQHPEKMVPTAILCALAGRAIPVYGDGENVRDWIHVEDHCAALDLVLRAGRVGEVYNIGASCERSNNQVAGFIGGILDARIEYVADRPGHDWRYAVDAGKIRDELGWAPRHATLATGLSETIRWYRENEAWWRPILKKEYSER